MEDVGINAIKPVAMQDLSGGQQDYPQGDEKQQRQDGQAAGFRVIRVKQGAGQRFYHRVVTAACQNFLKGKGNMWLQQANQGADQPEAQPGDRGDDHQQHHQSPGDFSGQPQGGAEHHAGQYINRCPQQGGDDDDHQKARGAHVHHAGDGGHNGAYRPDKTGHENTFPAVFDEVVDAAIHQPRVVPEGPDDPEALLVMLAQQEADKIAGNGAGRGRQHDRCDGEGTCCH